MNGGCAYAAGLVVTVVAFPSGLSIALAPQLVAALGTGRRGSAVAAFHVAFAVFCSLWGLPLLWVLGGLPLARHIGACGGLACANRAIHVLTATVALLLLAVFAAYRPDRAVKGYW